MKERPIIYKPESVQAILEGRKTQTRRVMDPQPSKACMGFKKAVSPYYWIEQLPVDLRAIYPNSSPSTINGQSYKCPYGTVGEGLWVRELFCYKADPNTAKVSEDKFWYKASNPEVIKIDGDGGQVFRKDGSEASPWISPLRMPRRASRITQEITDIRIQRLHNITEEDAEAEGVGPCPYDRNNPICQHYGGCLCHLQEPPKPYTCSYIELWDSINAKRGYRWIDDPWVWVLTTKLLEVKDK